MSVPYEADPFIIDTHDALAVTKEVNWPCRSWITKIVVNQVDGSPAAFTVDVFNHADALEGNETSQSDQATGQRFPEGLHKVGKTLNSDSAGLLEYFSENQNGGAGMVFVNKDVTPNKTKVNKLYFRITPAGVGNARFAVAIGGISALD